jgi:hypothetical protein
MVRGEAAPSLLSTSTAPDLTAADELYRTFRAAAARGEEACLSLTFREGKAGASLKLGETAGPPAAAARPRAPAQPARPQRAAGGPAPSCSLPAPPRPSPPAGRRRGPRSRGPGALLRDERRRHLRIASDVLDRSGQRGRCPLYTVYRPALHTPALVSGQEHVVQEVDTPPPRDLSNYNKMVLHCRTWILKLPPTPPPAPRLQQPGPPALRLRTRGWGVINAVKCSNCQNQCSMQLFEQSGWRWTEDYRNDGPNGTNYIWCKMCYDSDS